MAYLFSASRDTGLKKGFLLTKSYNVPFHVSSQQSARAIMANVINAFGIYLSVQWILVCVFFFFFFFFFLFVMLVL